VAADNDVPMPIQFVRRLKITREQEKNKKNKNCGGKRRGKSCSSSTVLLLGLPGCLLRDSDLLLLDLPLPVDRKKRSVAAGTPVGSS